MTCRSTKQADNSAAFFSAVVRGTEVLARIREAEGDAQRLALLMAESIAMAREARGISPIGRDGRTHVVMEELQAAYCMDAARSAYLRAIGSNTG